MQISAVSLTLFTSCVVLAQDGDRSRIINGYLAMPGDFQELVSIVNRTINYNFCGGTILNKDFVLTAAHCVYKKKEEDVVIISSTVNLMQGGRKYNVLKFILHEHYYDFRYDDIALIKVTPQFVLTHGELPVQLPSKTFVLAPGTQVIVVGWGRTTDRGLSIKELRMVNQTIISKEECRKYFGDEYEITLDKHICGRGNNTGFCKGDSGGPIFVNKVQVGVVSWFWDRCLDGNNVYTEVTSYLDWIDAKVLENSSHNLS